MPHDVRDDYNMSMPDREAGNSPLHVVVLAAGKGTRMRSSRPKVMHALAGLPLLQHVLRTVFSLTPTPYTVSVVHGHGGEAVQQAFAGAQVQWVAQPEQLGTGDAVRRALPQVDKKAVLLVAYGDVPLVRPGTLSDLAQAAARGLAILTAKLDDPTGYGRIIRDGKGAVRAVVEQKDANENEAAVKEINTGFLAAPAALLGPWLERLNNRNAQGEYYLTDVVAMAVQDGVPVVARETVDAWEIRGVNSRGELAMLERHYQRERAQELMREGVTVLDPGRLDVRGDAVSIGPDSELDVNVVIEGPARIGRGVSMGPNCVIRRAVIGNEVVVHPNCVIEDAVIGDRAVVGPFARIRPGTRLQESVQVGNFVEIKNSELAAGTKVNHLSYIGDSSVGREVNIGAGVITCNYDGANKHRTIIEDSVFVGSDTQLIAPVIVGEGATIGAGSTVTADVPPGNLAVARARQQNVAGWRRPQRKK